MRSSPSKYIITILIVVCIVGGIIYAVTRRQSPPPAPPSVVKPAPAPEQTQKVKVFRIAVSNNQARLQPVEVEVPRGKDPIESSLRQLIEQGERAGTSNSIPGGTKLLGLQMSNGLAIVNLSKEFRDNFRGGSEAEELTIGSILRTLGQFPEVKRVQLMVEGKPLGTLGHLDLSGPLDVSSADSSNGAEGGM